MNLDMSLEKRWRFYLGIEVELNHRPRAGFDVAGFEGEVSGFVRDFDDMDGYQTG